MGVHLIAQIYPEKNPERMKEYMQAIRGNLNHPDVECFHLFVEAPNEDFLTPNELELLSNPKCKRIIKKDKRLTFKDAIEYANSDFPAGSFALIINLDIELDPNSRFIFDGMFEKNPIVLALTRHDPKTIGSYDIAISSFIMSTLCGATQDAWGFVTPYTSIKFDRIDFPIGCAYGCDTTMAYWMWKSDRYPMNLCLKYKIIHRDDCRKAFSKDRGEGFGCDSCTIDSFKDLRAIHQYVLFTPIIYQNQNFTTYKKTCETFLGNFYQHWLKMCIRNVEIGTKALAQCSKK